MEIVGNRLLTPPESDDEQDEQRPRDSRDDSVNYNPYKNHNSDSMVYNPNKQEEQTQSLQSNAPIQQAEEGRQTITGQNDIRQTATVIEQINHPELETDFTGKSKMTIERQKLAEVIEVESYKEYNAMDDMTHTSQNCCSIY